MQIVVTELHGMGSGSNINFSKFLYLSLRQNQKCTRDNSSCKKLIGVLVLNFKAVFLAQV